MLSNIVPDWDLESTSPVPLDAAPLVFALERMAPGLLVPALPHEDLADVRSRRAAAADILDDLLAEYAAEAGSDGTSCVVFTSEVEGTA